MIFSPDKILQPSNQWTEVSLRLQKFWWVENIVRTRNGFALTDLQSQTMHVQNSIENSRLFVLGSSAFEQSVFRLNKIYILQRFNPNGFERLIIIIILICSAFCHPETTPSPIFQRHAKATTARNYWSFKNNKKLWRIIQRIHKDARSAF